MNNDLISREALKKAITDRLVSVTYNSDYTDGLQEGYLNTINEIDNAPAVSLQDIYQEGHYDGHIEGYTKAINEERLQGDLISRKALKDFAYINKGNFNTVEGIREWIDNAPAVEPYISPEVLNQFAKYVAEHERPQGKWIDTGNVGAKNWCSVCGEFILHYEGFSNYCPNCGADMRQEVKE